jgi:predicted Zn-ribbon and HTH transcriptional regulator
MCQAGVDEMTIHPNSRKSYEEEIANGNIATYRERILDLLGTENRPMTDRQIMVTLCEEEKSNILPVITRLVEKGILYEYDRVRCEFTGKTVRRTKVTQQQLF